MNPTSFQLENAQSFPVEEGSNDETHPVIEFKDLREKIKLRDSFDLKKFIQDFDFVDLEILKSFFTGREYPFDTQPNCITSIFANIKVEKYTMEGIRKRVDMKFVAKYGLLQKTDCTYPRFYKLTDEKFTRKIFALLKAKFTLE